MRAARCMFVEEEEGHVVARGQLDAARIRRRPPGNDRILAGQRPGRCAHGRVPAPFGGGCGIAGPRDDTKTIGPEGMGSGHDQQSLRAGHLASRACASRLGNRQAEPKRITRSRPGQDRVKPQVAPNQAGVLFQPDGSGLVPASATVLTACAPSRARTKWVCADYSRRAELRRQESFRPVPQPGGEHRRAQTPVPRRCRDTDPTARWQPADSRSRPRIRPPAARPEENGASASVRPPIRGGPDLEKRPQQFHRRRRRG